MNVRLLVVEDERAIAEPLARLFEGEGYAVEIAGTLREARARMAAPPALILLDWMLPDGQGIDLLREWRAAGIDAPVIFLTARTDLVDKVLGLEMGADDYVTKPFAPRELLARVRARLRATSGGVSPSEPPRLRHADIEMDPATRTVTFRGRAMETTKLEFDLLAVLVESPGRVFTRDELLNRVWGYERFPTTRTVDTHMLQLRQKLDPDLFETVRGVGYRLRARTNSDPGAPET